MMARNCDTDNCPNARGCAICHCVLCINKHYARAVCVTGTGELGSLKLCAERAMGPSIGRLTANATSASEELQRIRKLLTRANLPSANVFEAVAARTIAYRLLADAVRRGAVDITDVIDLLPADMLDFRDLARSE
jgi:hypothetical protein